MAWGSQLRTPSGQMHASRDDRRRREERRFEDTVSAETLAVSDAPYRTPPLGPDRPLVRRLSDALRRHARTFEDAAANQGLLILGAIITIYIVLGMLYESFVHPLTILSGLPAAAAGALLAIGWSGFDLSVIAVIGLPC